MKNYTYKWHIERCGFVEISEEEYTERQKEHKEFIDMLSAVVAKAKCGWDEVKYKVMHHPEGFNEKYMVLCVDGKEERWIPITGNSMGCNLSVLGENIW